MCLVCSIRQYIWKLIFLLPRLYNSPYQTNTRTGNELTSIIIHAINTTKGNKICKTQSAYKHQRKITNFWVKKEDEVPYLLQLHWRRSSKERPFIQWWRMKPFLFLNNISFHGFRCSLYSVKMKYGINLQSKVKKIARLLWKTNSRRITYNGYNSGGPFVNHDLPISASQKNES